MKTPVTSEAAANLINDMNHRLAVRARERADTAFVCRWIGIVFATTIITAIIVLLAGCSYDSPQVGEAREGSRAGLLFTERELRRNPDIQR